MNINLRANGSSDGPVEWTIDDTHPTQSVIEFARNAGPQVLHFILDDQTGRDFHFDRSGPFWADKNLSGGCPSAGSICDQTSVLSCNDGQLVIRNENSGDACTVHYQLNLLDRAGNPEGVDPIIKNGGSG